MKSSQTAFSQTSQPNSFSRSIKGRVIQSTGRRCIVQVEGGQKYECAIRGKFRIQDINATNPVAVGDWVIIQIHMGEGLGLVTELLPRNNYILRKAVAQAHKVHILCANVDQALLLFTVDYPATSYGFADRFLLITTAFEIPTKVVINKIDLLNQEEQLKKMDEVKGVYEKVGIEVIMMSSIDTSYREKVYKLLKDQVTFVGGHSGSGKSTFINLVDPNYNIKTSDISHYTSKGRHTTTYAEMYPLQGGGYIIDSPGIKELGIATFDKAEVSHNFLEMFTLLDQCRFNNCIHINEPGCAVKAAVELGEIPESRYQSYLSILAEIDESINY